MGFHDTFQALGHPVRRGIIEQLKTGKKTAGEIAAGFVLTGATVSHHLSQLKNAGLIAEERQGRFIYYELNASVFEELLSWVLQIRGDKK